MYNEEVRRWLILLGLVVTACGGGSAPSSTSPSVQEDALITVVAEDNRFIPATITVDSGTTIELRNDGAVVHTWTVLAEPIEEEADLGQATTLAEGRVDAGQSVRIDLSALGPGTYQVVCVIPGHISAGMVGELIVTEG